MTYILGLLLGLLLIFLIPSLIVIFWKRRPVLAFVAASIFLCLSLVAPSTIKTFQAMMIYGMGDPQLLAGGVSEAIVRLLLGLPVYLPILALIQWIARRRYKRKPSVTSETIEDAFL